jgi:hypothetical protein
VMGKPGMRMPGEVADIEHTHDNPCHRPSGLVSTHQSPRDPTGRTVSVPASSIGCTAFTESLRLSREPLQPTNAVKWVAAHCRYTRPPCTTTPTATTPRLLHAPAPSSQYRHIRGSSAVSPTQAGPETSVSCQGGCEREGMEGGGGWCVCVSKLCACGRGGWLGVRGGVGWGAGDEEWMGR